MRKKMKVVMILIIIISALVCALSFTYAWFSNVETSQPIIFNTGSLTADLKLYQGFDTNGDDIIDNYQEVTDSISFQNVIPGQIYDFRIIVNNQGTIDGNLDLAITEIEFSDEELLSGFKLSYNYPEDDTYKEINFLNNTQNIIIFENCFLKKGEVLNFDFAIHAKKELSINNYAKFKIISFAIKLEQIH